jgi:hypothetical protein
MTPAHYVEKGRDQGIVAIPEWTNDWPTHYEDAAIDLIKAHVGSSYVIIDRYPVVVGNSSNNPHMSSDPSNPAPNSTSTKTEYRIVYARKPVGPGIPFGSPMPAPYATRPMLPPGAGMGAPPPGVLPAGAYTPGSVTGPMTQGPPMNPYIVPSVAPASNPYTAPPPGANPYSVAPAGNPYTAPPPGANPYVAPGVNR